MSHALRVDDAPTSAQSERPRRGGRLWRWCAGVLVGSVVLVAPQTVRVDGVSMEPTLHEGDRLLVGPWAGQLDTWDKGDLVVLKHTVPGTPGRSLLVKRVVGLPGDTVALADGALVVNGVTVAEEYADPRAIDSVYFGPVQVAPGEVFVMGDNRAESWDSRDFGSVPVSSLEGRVVAVLWPPDRAWGWWA